MIVNADYIEHLLECLWKDLEDFWVFGRFEDSFECLQAFQDVHLSQWHLALDVLIVDCGRIVAYHSDESENFNGLTELLQAFWVRGRYCVHDPAQVVSPLNQRKQQRQNVKASLQM